MTHGSDPSCQPSGVGSPQPALLSQAVGNALAVSAFQSFGLGGAIVGAALGPAFAQSFEFARTELADLVGRRRGLLIRSAAEHAGQDPASFVDALASDPEKLNLMVFAWEAATRTAVDDKIRVLGMTLATGALADDRARIDAESLVVRAVADIEALHVRAMMQMPPTSKDVPAEGVSEIVLASRLSISNEDAAILQPVLQTLERNALIVTLGIGDTFEQALVDESSGARDSSNRWGLTDFGVLVIDRFRRANEVELR